MCPRGARTGQPIPLKTQRRTPRTRLTIGTFRRKCETCAQNVSSAAILRITPFDTRHVDRLWLNPAEQLLQRDVQCLGEPADVHQGGIPFAPLDAANIRAIEAGLQGQPLLGKASGLAECAKPFAETFEKTPTHSLRRVPS